MDSPSTGVDPQVYARRGYGSSSPSGNDYGGDLDFGANLGDGMGARRRSSDLGLVGCGFTSNDPPVVVETSEDRMLMSTPLFFRRGYWVAGRRIDLHFEEDLPLDDGWHYHVIQYHLRRGLLSLPNFLGADWSLSELAGLKCGVQHRYSTVTTRGHGGQKPSVVRLCYDPTSRDVREFLLDNYDDRVKLRIDFRDGVDQVYVWHGSGGLTTGTPYSFLVTKVYPDLDGDGLVTYKSWFHAFVFDVTVTSNPWWELVKLTGLLFPTPAAG